ncbi:MAG: hypothetical protein KDD61_09945, partial [Bdellovibrionales bacterium]|nr:hypothetical protein [Bdellovibrionales bacterium]
DDVALVYFEKCEALLQNADKIVAFRAFSSAVSTECETKLKSLGFNITRPYPSWLEKMVFTKRALKRFSTETRIQFIMQIKSLIDRKVEQDGHLKATGIRGPFETGALTQKEFDTLVNKTHKDQRKGNFEFTTLDIAVKDSITSFYGYKTFIETLKSMGIRPIEHRLSQTEFSKKFGNGEIQTDYDLFFFAMGSGDPDPDGNWRFAAAHFYGDTIDSKKVSEAYYTLNDEERMEMYKSFERKLFLSGRYIPIVINKDVIGIHGSHKFVSPASFRFGMSFYDKSKK